MNTQKGFVSLGIIVAIVVAVGVYYIQHRKEAPEAPVVQDQINVSVSTGKDPSKVTTNTESSAKTFQPLSVGQTVRDGNGGSGYTRDSSGIYLMGLNGRAGKVVADTTTFEVNTEWPIYARDASHVYVYGKIIEGADPKTFVAVCGYPMQLESFCAYGKDSKHVYAFNQIIPEAIPESFVSFNESGKSWIGNAIDASAYYLGYVPAKYGDLNGKLSGARISTLSDGTPLHFSDTSKVVAIDLNDSSWGGYYEGVKIGSKSYYGGTYLVDGSKVYTVYSACDIGAGGKENNCTLMLSRVDKVGDRPAGL